jgi:uncharacterized protein YjiS (DUF1127 family)
LGRLIRSLIPVGLLVLCSHSWAAADEPFFRITIQDPPAEILAEPEFAGAAREIEAQWAAWAGSVAAGVGLDEPAPVRIYLFGSQRFARLARGGVAEWGLGFATWPGGPIVLDLERLARDRKNLAELTRHELSHVYLGQRLGRAPPPRWFIEGIAQLQAGEWRVADRLVLVRAGTTGRLPELRDAGDFAGNARQAHVAYVASLWTVSRLGSELEGRGGLPALIDAAAEAGRFDLAFEEFTGLRPPQYAAESAAGLRMRYGWLAVLTDPPSLFGAMTLLFLLGAWMSRRRSRQRLLEMEAEELAIPSNPEDT